MMKPIIAFIGGGNMATSLIGGLCQRKYPPENIQVAEPDPTKNRTLQDTYHVKTYLDNKTAIASADVVIFAIKPQVAKDVCAETATSLMTSKPLIISIMAGVEIASIQTWLGFAHDVVRTMPNTPALLGAGATGMYADEQVSVARRTLATDIMSCTGLAQWVTSEALLNAVTAISGSGPAYFFLFMEALEEAGITLGLDADTSRALTLQTAVGAARMAAETKLSPGELRIRVTSPGGTTAKALESFKAAHFNEIVLQAAEAAKLRAEEMARNMRDIHE